MVQEERDCRICGNPIDAERLAVWHWCVTCSPECSDKNAAETARQARRRYRRRRRKRSAGDRPVQEGGDGDDT